jgi:Rrf2 family protein
MPNILKISEAASLALHSTVLLAANPDKLISTREIASMLHVSEAHLSKVLQRLTRTGIVRAIRGPRGGFRLVKPANETTLLDVYESIEGTLIPSKCLFDSPICEGDACILGGLLETVDEQVRDYLAKTKLDDLTSIYRSVKSANA